MRLKYLILLGSLALLPFVQGQEGGVWIIDQEFVKLGKKDVYELLKKKRLDELSKKGFPLFALQDSEPSEYIYLTPLQDFADLDSYFSAEKLLKEARAQEKDEKLESTYHFKVASLQRYLSHCSYTNADILDTPYLAYYIYSIDPGADDGYETYLQKIAEDLMSKKSSLNMRTWKCAFGSDLPKFIICIFAKSKEELDAQQKNFNLTEGVSKTIFRNQHEGKALLRKDLSTFTSAEKS